jgi:hypothetical protein
VLALERGQSRGHDDPGRLCLEVRHERDAQEVLLGGQEEVGAVGGDRPPMAPPNWFCWLSSERPKASATSAAVAVEVEELAVERVRARLRHDVDEAGAVRPTLAAAPARTTWNSSTAAWGKKKTPSLPPRWLPCRGR